jgi:hypothetical protein
MDGDEDMSVDLDVKVIGHRIVEREEGRACS